MRIRLSWALRSCAAVLRAVYPPLHVRIWKSGKKVRNFGIVDQGLQGDTLNTRTAMIPQAPVIRGPNSERNKDAIIGLKPSKGPEIIAIDHP